MRPRHYEILARVVKGESQRQIAKAMNIGEPRLSVIINSPIFQDELNSRLRFREQEMHKPRNEKTAKRVLSPTHTNFPEGLGENIIRALAQARAKDNKALGLPAYKEPAATEAKKPEPEQPIKAEPLTKPVSAEKQMDGQSEAPGNPIQLQRPKFQAARFYSQTLGEWIWLMFDYPGERLAYGTAQQILRLTNGGPWKIFPRSFRPSDGYSYYSSDEIPQLRGKSPEELRALHQRED